MKLTACLLFVAVQISFAADIVCPQTIKTQQSATGLPAGWTAMPGEQSTTLETVSMYSHHPKENATLKPDRNTKAKGAESDIWTFKREKGDEYWAACVYNNTTVFLAQKLGPAVTRCEVKYAASNGRRDEVKGIDCR